MATSYKVLGQAAPTAATNTTLYTVPSATQAVTSTLAICNTSGTTTSVRVAIRPGGEALAAKHYIMYDVYINSNDSIFTTLGMSLAAGDVVTVYAANATISFTLFGSEIA